ncbi:MAG: CYTH domain-containing protein [Muribaculaceae bacterium]|nr:CYTH domain-containing protein [Muribaculaceae bacterium]
MAFEIEHKYLVINDSYKNLATGKVEIEQGYLNRNPDRTVRIRILGDKGFLTVKSRNHGAKRLEFEYEIPVEEAREIIKLSEPGIVKKTRYFVPYDRQMWEVDEFHDSLQGVTVAEVELPDVEHCYQKPPFVGEDITGNPAFYNSNLKACH